MIQNIVTQTIIYAEQLIRENEDPLLLIMDTITCGRIQSFHWNVCRNIVNNI